MATFKQSQKWLKEGEKIFLPSETGHIYSLNKAGIEVCSCGREVGWLSEYTSRKDWARVKIKGINVKKLELEDVSFYMDETNQPHIKRLLKQFVISEVEE